MDKGHKDPDTLNLEAPRLAQYMHELKDYFLTETYVEFNQESMTVQRLPEDVDYDDAAIGGMLFVTHTEDKSIIPNEKACRLVCRRRHFLKIERDNPLWTVTKVMIEQGKPL